VKIEVQLFGWLRKYQPGSAGKAATVEVPEGATVSDVLRRVGVSEMVQGDSTGGASLKPAGAFLLVLVNGLQAADDTRLGPGDSVSVFPPIGGG